MTNLVRIRLSKQVISPEPDWTELATISIRDEFLEFRPTSERKLYSLKSEQDLPVSAFFDPDTRALKKVENSQKRTLTETEAKPGGPQIKVYQTLDNAYYYSADRFGWFQYPRRDMANLVRIRLNKQVISPESDWTKLVNIAIYDEFLEFQSTSERKLYSLKSEQDLPVDILFDPDTKALNKVEDPQKRTLTETEAKPGGPPVLQMHIYQGPHNSVYYCSDLVTWGPQQ